MKRVAGIVMVLLLASATLFAASSTTATLRGVVRDSTGAILPGVLIELSGPQVRSTRRVLTDSYGEFRFALLTPDDRYQLSAGLDGFETVRQTSVRVLLGREATLNLHLRPSTSDEVTVTAARSLINVRDTSTSTNITSELFEALPTRRDYQYLTVLAPGVVFDAEWDPLSPRIGGATHQENDYIIEGVSTRDPLLGGSAAKVTMDFVRDVQVMSGEFSAEYGRATGGVINLVTKSGTNEFQGSLITYYEDSSWASEAPKRTIRGTTTFGLGNDRSDWGASLGGPLLKDRSWFFLSYDRRYNVAPIHLVDVTFGIDRNEQVRIEEDVYSGKATAALTSSQSLTLSAFGSPTVKDGWVTQFARMTPAAALRDERSGSKNAALRYESILRTAWIIEGTLGRHRQETSIRASTPEGRAAPLQVDWSRSPNFYYGGFPGEGGTEASRDAYSARGSGTIQRHQIRFGGDYEKNRYDDTTVWTQFDYNGSRNLGGAIGVADSMQGLEIYFTGWGSNDITTLFVQDQWQITPRLNLNMGLRWEEQELSSGRGVVLATGRSEDGSVLRRAADSVTLDDNWAPRLGVAWDPRGDGRAKIYAAGGRYYEAVPVHMNVQLMNGYGYTTYDYYSRVTHSGASWVNPNGSPVNEDWILYNTSSYWYGGYDEDPMAIDPDTKLQNQEEFSVGTEVQLGRSWVAGARYINRQLGDVIEDHHVIGSDGRSVDYVISNIGAGAFASEFRKPERKYQAIELTLQKFLTARWQLLSSFVHARARGDYDGLYNYINFNTGTGPHATFDIEKPEWQLNTYGRLRSDVPYQFKLHSSYRFPFGLTLSEGFTYSAGTPISAVFLGFPIGGVRTHYFLPRGKAGRTPDYYQLDLHADWKIPIGARGATVAFIVDAYNVTGEDEALHVDDALVYRGMPGWQQWVAPGNLDETGLPRYNPDLPVSPFYKSPRVYQPPRSFQVGLKLNF